MFHKKRDNNIKFSIYSPVKKDSNSIENKQKYESE